jgi:peptide-methionine (S)-S-oxide reductase
MGDHTESVQVDFDPGRVTYRQLLDIFWDAHDPARPQGASRQYMTAVFYHSDRQRQVALESLDRVSTRHGEPVTTRILPATPFTRAESYHQKYMLRQQRNLFQEYRAIYPEDAAFIDSTATARVNGYVGGYGGIEALRGDLAGLGLSPAGARRLMEIVALRRESSDMRGPLRSKPVF